MKRVIRPLLFLLAAFAPVALLAVYRSASAMGIPAAPTLHYSGQLSENGAPFRGPKPITVALWTAETAGTKVCEKTETTNVQAGRFRIALGDDCLAGVRANPNLWVQVTVEGIEFARRKLGAVPYAVEAERAAVADAVPFSGVTGLATTTEWPGTVAASRVTGLKAGPTIQSGVQSLGGDMTGWPLGEGAGDRRFTIRVNFGAPFAGTPVVQTMLNFFDGTGETGMRLDVKPISIDNMGFTLQVRTWGDSTVAGLRVVWIAYD